MVMNKVGDVHVHAPWDRKDLLKEFEAAYQKEKDRWSIENEITKV